MIQQMAAYTFADPTPILYVPWIITKRGGVMSGRIGALKPGKLGLSYKVYKWIDAGTGDLSVLPSHESIRTTVGDVATSTSKNWRHTENMGTHVQG